MLCDLGEALLLLLEDELYHKAKAVGDLRGMFGEALEDRGADLDDPGRHKFFKRLSLVQLGPHLLDLLCALVPEVYPAFRSENVSHAHTSTDHFKMQIFTAR